jgi:hypothetical protein
MTIENIWPLSLPLLIVFHLSLSHLSSLSLSFSLILHLSPISLSLPSLSHLSASLSMCCDCHMHLRAAAALAAPHVRERASHTARATSVAEKARSREIGVRALWVGGWVGGWMMMMMR